MHESDEIFQHEKVAIYGFLETILPDNEKFCYVKHLQPYQLEEEDLFRCLVVQINQVTKDPVTKLVFDINIQETDFPILYIKKQRINSLKEQQDPHLSFKLLSVHFLHKKTLVFDILKLEQEHKTTETKDSIYVDITDAKSFDYIYRTDTAEEPEFEAFPKEEEEAPEAFPKDDPLMTPGIYSADITPAIPREEKKALSESIAIATLKQEEPNPLQYVIFKPDADRERRLGIRRDESGDIIFDTAQEYDNLPFNIQWEVTHRHLINKTLKPDENKQEMINKYGSVEALYNFVRERQRIEFLGLEIENQYEIKQEQ